WLTRRNGHWWNVMKLVSRLEPCRPFAYDPELPLEGQSHLPDQTIIEQTAEDCDTVRHATRRTELWQRIRRIRSPVTSRFRDLDESGAQRERGMTGEVRYRELLVAERWHDQ